MKRKQKVPRRTRRQNSLNPADNAESSGNYNNTNECNIEENSKPQISNVKDASEKGKLFPCNSNEFKHANNSSLNHLKIIEESQQATKKSTGNCTAISKQQLEPQLENHSGNSNVLNRNLKRPLDNGALSEDVFKRPFVNFRNGLENSNMPVILNVFTLSKIPDSPTKQKIANRVLENNFPVTPPCSPPLLKHEQLTGMQNISSRSKAVFSSGNGLTTPTLNKSTMASNVYGIYDPSGRDRRNYTNVFLPVHSETMNQSMSQRNSTVENGTTRCYDAYNSSNIQLPEANLENDPISLNRKFVPTGRLVIKGNNPFAGSTSRNVPGNPDKRIFSELLQDIERKHLYRNEASNMTSQEQRNIENSRLVRLSTSPKNAVLFSNLESTTEEHQMRIVHNLVPNSPMVHSDGNTNTAKDDHTILSPRDVKVLQLKKKLQEQEAAIKKLRKNH